MDDNTDDGFEGEENYYAFLNISKSASASNRFFIYINRVILQINYEMHDVNTACVNRKRKLFYWLNFFYRFLKSLEICFSCRICRQRQKKSIQRTEH